MIPTEKRIEILKAIHRFVQQNKYSPSIRELCDLVNLKSTSAVHRRLEKLEKEGFITKTETYIRTIALTEKAMALIKGEVKNELNLDVADLKILLFTEKFARENGFVLTKEFEDVVSKIACIVNK